MLRAICFLVLLGSISCKDDIDRLLDTVEGFIYGIDSKVVELTDDSFNTEMKKFETAFVEFIAPWCPHCKRLTPDFEKAAKVLTTNDIPVTFVKVNCDGPGYHTCHHANADIYPTLKLYRNGVEERRYYGERTPKDLVRYALNMLGDHAKAIDTEEELNKFTVSDPEYMFVGAFAEETDLAKEFLKLAEESREFFKFALVQDPKLLKKLGQINAVIAYQPEFLRNKWESSTKVFSGEPFDLKNFMHSSRVDLVGMITKKTTKDFEISRPLLITTFDVDFDVNRKHTNYVRNRLLKVASEYSPRVTFAMGNLNMTHYYAPDDRYNDTGVVMTVITKEGWEYTVPKELEFSLDNVKQVVEDILSGKIEGKPYKTDEPPVQKKRVKKVVATTFHDMVLDDSKHVLIEFYSPYCGHCKQFIPAYNELASRAREDSNLLIAKMDAVSNSLPRPFESRGFPTIYFVPKGRNSRPIKFEGDRSIENIISFMQANTKEDLHFVEPEEKFIKTSSEEQDKKEDSGTCSGSPDGQSSEGQCSAGKSEL